MEMSGKVLPFLFVLLTVISLNGYQFVLAEDSSILSLRCSNLMSKDQESLKQFGKLIGEKYATNLPKEPGESRIENFQMLNFQVEYIDGMTTMNPITNSHLRDDPHYVQPAIFTCYVRMRGKATFKADVEVVKNSNVLQTVTVDLPSLDLGFFVKNIPVKREGEEEKKHDTSPSQISIESLKLHSQPSIKFASSIMNAMAKMSQASASVNNDLQKTVLKVLKESLNWFGKDFVILPEELQYNAFMNSQQGRIKQQEMERKRREEIEKKRKEYEEMRKKAADGSHQEL